MEADCCAAYLAHRRHARDEDGTAIGDRSPGTEHAAAQVPIDLLDYQGAVYRRPAAADLALGRRRIRHRRRRDPSGFLHRCWPPRSTQ